VTVRIFFTTKTEGVKVYVRKITTTANCAKLFGWVQPKVKLIKLLAMD